MSAQMDNKAASTRRAFLKGAAVAAAPVATGTAAAVAAREAHAAELARLKDEAAIRALHQEWLRKVNAGDRAEAARLHRTVVRLSADPEGAADKITVAAEGRSAEGRFHLLVETEVERPLESTLAQMAAAQGEGMIRSAARHLVTADYAKGEDGWAMRKVTLQDV